MKCKICNAQCHEFARASILNKYGISYFQCSNCSFVQTEEPFWLEEAYSEAIAGSDIGLVSRNITLARVTSNIVFNFFNHSSKFLDYGGGYGLFVRMMRDSGFDFYWQDKFCMNIFAKGFEVEEKDENKYELVTAFEVFEHFVNPLPEIEKILEYSRTILFSTELLPASNPKPNEWWYYALQEGQHISIYTNNALSIIARRFKLNLYSDNSSLHLLTEKELPHFVFNGLSRHELNPINKISLLQQDYLAFVGKLKSSETDPIAAESEEQGEQKLPEEGIKILVDGVFFQLYKTGIARLWNSLLKEWENNSSGNSIIVLDRAGTAPKIPGIRYLTIPPYDYKKVDVDRELLQRICNEENVDIFVSTYYTTPLSTPSVFIAYDMIPEVLGWDLENPMWREKHYAIKHASAYIAISENTARDLVKFFPTISPLSVTVALCGVHPNFFPGSLGEISHFQSKYGISKPYFMIVGTGGYKNTILFLQAFTQLYSRQGFEIVCTGSGSFWEEDYRDYTSGNVVHMLQLSDEELRAAYSGAVALVYPSKYEGFGLPVLEAFACGCPVITCPNASIPEVAGEAALYVNDDDVDALANALCDIQKPSVRRSLISAGLEQAKKFSWSKMAHKASSALIEATLLSLRLRNINFIVFPDWSASEESIFQDLERVIGAIASLPDCSRMTLLVDTCGISEEDANLLLSGVVMNLLVKEDLDVTQGMEISLVGHLVDSQWKVLLPRIKARIILENENEQAIANTEAMGLPACEVDSLP